jgi:serine/threonine protein kinase/formylglycine-generating enzyme required for sulfatase activity/dienelactone hydrolase
MSQECPKCHTKIGENSKFCSECGSQVIAAGEAAVSVTKTLKTPTKGVRIGAAFAERYRIIDELGQGGMGIVYKAEDLRLKRPVALKFLPPELTQDEEAKERFVLEARAAAAISHPNICTIHEIDDFEDQTYIAMEFVEGQSLRELTKKDTIPVADSLDLAIQVASGLEVAHKKGVVHRDIKSANIMVTPSGQAKIMDFGLAKVSGSALITQEGVTMGTVAYMSPEQARGEKVDNRTDIWSLGVVLYEILAGQLPFWGDKEASILYSIENRKHKPIKAFNPSITTEFEAIIDRCLQKEPDARYKSAEDIISELKKYQDSLRAEEAGFFTLKSLLRRFRKPIVAIPAIIVLGVIIFFSVQYFNRQAKIRWAREELLPEVGRLVDNSQTLNTIEAYKKAVEAEQYLADDPTLREYFDQCSLNISIKTSPCGANIYMKEYAKPDEGWTNVGLSPLEKVRVPIGYFRWKIEKDGYETVLAASCTFQLDFNTQKLEPYNLERTLDPVDSTPPDMVRVGKYAQIEDFFIDRYEVTNRKYKEFMDSGGYQNKEYWKQPFIKDGKALSWEEAVREFVDSTGRQGPSTWVGGTYPNGQEDYPVSGVSWHEAAAYAEYAGKSLPTIFHWQQAVGVGVEYTIGLGFLSELTPLSKYGGDGASRVGSHPGIGFYGVFDMAGNVREWCWNESSSERLIAGGAWNDATYMIVNYVSASAFDRSEKNGFRCVKYLANVPERAFRPISLPEFPDYTKMQPVSDEVFATLRERYFYDKSELNIKVEKEDKTSEYWDMQKVTFDAAYGNERTGACLFFPKRISPPFQTVVFFPGAGGMWVKSSDNLDKTLLFKNVLDFIVKDGRAVVYPLYKGFFERSNPGKYFPLIRNFNSYEGAEYWSQLLKDFRRALDYLETRNEIDMDKIAMLSYSWGIFAGTILPAIEERLAVNVICLAGMGLSFSPETKRAELNPINFVGRVTMPTILLNGRHDAFYPLETSAKPLYFLMGTPEGKKHHKIYELDHAIQKNVIVRDVLWFLDEYLGPVKRPSQN